MAQHMCMYTYAEYLIYIYIYIYISVCVCVCVCVRAPYAPTFVRTAFYDVAKVLGPSVL